MENDYRNYLFESFVKVVDHYRPKVFVFENVPGMLSAKPGGRLVIERICEAFENKGVSYRLITNAYYDTMEARGVNVIQSGGSGGKSFGKVLDILGMASGAAMCKTEELLQRTCQNMSQEKGFVYLCQRKDDETEALVARLEQKYRIHFHRIYGEDFEAAYLAEENRGKKEKQ
jgi:hypothetical protein